MTLLSGIFRNPGVQKFSDIRNWHKCNPEIILYSSFSFCLLGFSHKAQQTLKNYDRVTTKQLQTNTLGGERRKGGAPSLCRHAGGGPLCGREMVGPPEATIQLPAWQPGARLATSQWERALLVPCFLQLLWQGKHKG